jgi:hypothetical protein
MASPPAPYTEEEMEDIFSSMMEPILQEEPVLEGAEDERST